MRQVPFWFSVVVPAFPVLADIPLCLLHVLVFCELLKMKL